jgi:serine/threonine protein kinase
LSRERLIDEVDRILAGGRANATWLLETLEEENTKVPLPADVHAEVRGRIEQAAQHREALNDDGPVAPAGQQSDEDPDASRTRLATSLFPGEPAALRPPASRSLLQDNVETLVEDLKQSNREEIKGTGDVLNDRFVLEECVGAGGMSTVYKALDRRKLEADDRNPYVAVKVLNLEFRSHPDSLIALQREAKKSQSLAHTNIVRVYDFDRDGSTVYMTMEYLPGKPLAKVLRAPDFQGLEKAEAMAILDPVARALIFAHENGIVHADFKPANIILTDDGKVKVIDFGIARAFQRPEDSDVEATRFDPGSLGALTPTYASPEMLEHREPDPRDDVYALACITYEMLTGRHPFGRMQANEARDGGLELKRRNLSRRHYKALKAALAFDREKRTATVRDFVNAMQPEKAIPVPLPVAALARAAVVAVVVIAGFLFFVPDLVERYFVADSSPGGAPGNGSGPDGVELASLDTARVNAPAAEQPPTQAIKDAVADEPVDTATPAAADGQEQPLVTASVTDIAPAATAPVASTVSLEDGVAAVLNGLSCAAVTASMQDGAVQLRGYVSERLDVGALEQDLLALPGAQKVSFDLKTVDQGKCAIIDLFAPYWLTHQAAGSGASIAVRGEDNQLVEGDPLVVDITTPDYKTYVNVDYFSLDGGVVHMLPGPRAPDNQAPPNYRATIGDLGEWRIARPFGTEMVTLILTPQPLFGTTRQEYEKNTDYLAAVRERLDQISAEEGRDSVAVDFVMIDTKPKSLLQQLLSDS